ncbi:MAG: CaiB/BaiF CoA transferase family protein [Acidimicrobiales bacterium]
MPLAGLRVLDLGQIYQGPYCGFLFAMAGAEVIKVEPPGGEPLRRRDRLQDGHYPFILLNGNKRAVSLNLKDERGKELLRRLVEQSDVLIENFAPGVMDRLGVGAAALREVNPRLVYASGTGYGLSGPDRDNLAMDVTVQAYAGVMSVTGWPDRPPVKAGAAVADFMGGVNLYAAVVTALLERERTGVSRSVEVAMQEALLPTLASNLGMLYETGASPRTGSRHAALSVAPYNVYECADGHVALITVVEAHWRTLCDAMGRPELAHDERYSANARRAEHIDEVDEIVGAWTAGLTTAEVFAAAQRHHVPVAPVRTLPEVAADPHLHERGMLEWVEHHRFGRMALMRSPLRFDGAPGPALEPHPGYGEHNRDVYCGLLGLGEEELAALAADGVV